MSDAEKIRRLEQHIAAAEKDLLRRQEQLARRRHELVQLRFTQYVAEHGVKTVVELPAGAAEWLPPVYGTMGDGCLTFPEYLAYVWRQGYWEVRDGRGERMIASVECPDAGRASLECAMADAEAAIRAHAAEAG